MVERDTSVTRRGFLASGAALIASSAVAGGLPGLGANPALGQTSQPAAPAADGPFTLPALPYAHDALEPSIDTLTMQIHHGKHHAGYVSNLNKALVGHADLGQLAIGDLLAHGATKVPEGLRQTVINNGGGHSNHSLFWQGLAPAGRGGKPSEKLAQAIEGTFGSLANLQAAMNEAGAKRFGSGWAWLVRSAAGNLEVLSTANQDSPLMTGQTPLFGIDVWEHAYYLQYQNRRGDYLKAIWEVAHWSEISRRFDGA